MVAGFLISAGWITYQIGGPTGAFVVIVAGIVVKFGAAGLVLVGIMAGLLLLVRFNGPRFRSQVHLAPVTIGLYQRYSPAARFHPD